MKIEIKSRWSGNVLFGFGCENNSLKLTLEAAVKARADLFGANLSGANLSRANLSRADLSGANLSRADLSGADLSGANLSRADLSGANLSRANLSGANLSRANLSRADLSGANLSRADLSGGLVRGELVRGDGRQFQAPGADHRADRQRAGSVASVADRPGNHDPARLLLGLTGSVPRSSQFKAWAQSA